MQTASFSRFFSVTVTAAAVSTAFNPSARAQGYQQQATRENAPHSASAIYSGALTPITDVKSLISGKTLYLEHPIVANQQVQRMDTKVLYMAADGRFFSDYYNNLPWSVSGNQFCIADSKPQNCQRMFQDSTHQFFVMSGSNLVMHLSRLESGDSTHARATYEAAIRIQGQMQSRALAQNQTGQSHSTGPSPVLNALQGALVDQASTPQGLWNLLSSGCHKQKPVTLGGQTTWVSDCD